MEEVKEILTVDRCVEILGILEESLQTNTEMHQYSPWEAEAVEKIKKFVQDFNFTVEEHARVSASIAMLEFPEAQMLREYLLRDMDSNKPIRSEHPHSRT